VLLELGEHDAGGEGQMRSVSFVRSFVRWGSLCFAGALVVRGCFFVRI
jgi:hypothetical protein